MTLLDVSGRGMPLAGAAVYVWHCANPGQTPLDADMVFSDGYTGKLPGASGSAASGLTLKLNVGVRAVSARRRRGW